MSTSWLKINIVPSNSLTCPITCWVPSTGALDMVVDVVEGTGGGAGAAGGTFPLLGSQGVG